MELAEVPELWVLQAARAASEAFLPAARVESEGSVERAVSLPEESAVLAA